MYDDRPYPGPRAKPCRDHQFFNNQRGCVATPRPRWRTFRQKRPLGDPYRRQVKNRSKVQGQPGSPRMVTAGCIYKKHVGRLRQPPHCGLEKTPLTYS